MNLLSDKDQILFMDKSVKILNDTYNKYYVIYDETNNIIIGTGKIHISNSGKILKVCNIEHIIIDKNQKDLKLKELMLDYLKKVALSEVGCIQCNVLV
tara:strand:- start:242 stop:535 length:294 start_codon:yes stop_codon:yes gene_type:complete